MVVALYATHLEALGRFLKVYGQTNHNDGLAIEGAIQKVVKLHSDVQGSGDNDSGGFSKGEICLSKYSDGLYYRCEVIELMAGNNVLVHFLDYGNDEMISTKDMISLKAMQGVQEAEYLLNAIAQAKEYILAAYWNTHWTEQSLAEIRAMVVNSTVAADMFSSVRDFVFINISIVEHGIADLANYLIERGIGQTIDLRSQREQLMLIVDGLQENAGPSAYLPNALSMHTTYEVMVSHVQDGPFLFYVQLKKEQQELECMMQDLQRLRLRDFPTDILIGMACLVRHDGVIYRGLVSQIGPTSVVVTLVDYGRRVVVAYASVFEIPARFAQIKEFAIRSTIAGYKKLDKYNKQLKERFREIVMGPEGCNITIKVTPLEGSATVHYCEVYQGKDMVVYNELQRLQTKHFELGLNEPVPNGFEGHVRITACYSPARFYVRMLQKEDEYQTLALLLNDYYESEPRPALTELRIGAICALKAGAQWYRTEITDIKKTDNGQRILAVNFVDVGRDAQVGLTVLKRLNYDLCQIPPLALECGLCDVNVEEDPRTVVQFLRAINLDKYPNRVYTMRTYTRTTFKSYLIDLLDAKGVVKINRLLDGETPISLDKYYQQQQESTPSATDARITSDHHSIKNNHPSVATTHNTTTTTIPNDKKPKDLGVAPNSHSQDLHFVMPQGRELAVTLVSWQSVDEFYVHIKDQQTSFVEFQKALQGVPRMPINFRVSTGFLVLTPYAVTGQLHRAEVYDYNEMLHKYKVLFVDLGVRGIVNADQIYENPFLLTQVPKFSHKCCLVDREKLGAQLRDPEAMKRIGAILSGAVTLTCVVKERLKDELNEIKVTIDGRDLLEKVLEAENAMGSPARITAATVKEPAVVGETKKRTEEFLGNNVEGLGGNGGGKLNVEILRNQKMWIKAVDFLSKEVFRFSIKDVKSGATGGDLLKGAFERGAVQFGGYMAVEVVRVVNQILYMRPIKETILPQLILEDTFSATVCEPPTTALNQLSVQFISSLGPLTRLLMDMKKHYETSPNVLTLETLSQSVGEYFAVFNPEDSFWHRAQLIQAIDDKHLHFQLFDYGREVIVDMMKVHPLEEQFRDFNQFAIPMYLALEQFTEKISAEVIMREIHNLTRNISLIVRVLENYRGCWIVDIVSNGFSLGQALAEKKLAISCAMGLVRKQIDRQLLIKTAESEEEVAVEEDRKLQAVEIGHFDSPERIFVQLKQELPELKRMQETLQIIAPSLTAIGAAKSGELCIAQNSFDGLFYRARILDSAPDMTSVQFIDYGNTDVITSDRGAKLKKMIDEFADIPEFAKFCSLSMRPANQGDRRRIEWDDDVFALLSQYMDRPNKEVEFLTETKLKRYFIRLFVQGEDMEAVLKQHKWGESIQLIRSGSVCYISHINSLAEFFIHLEQDGSVLDLLNDYFLNAPTFQAVKEPQVGDVYAALFEDGDWYRAKILRKCSTMDGYDAMFIDYGNTAIVTNVKEIESKEIRDIPPLTRKCKLHMPKNLLRVSMEAEALFEEVAQGGRTVLQVQLVGFERDYTVVELIVKETGKSLLDMLPLDINPYEHDPDFDH